MIHKLWTCSQWLVDSDLLRPKPCWKQQAAMIMAGLSRNTEEQVFQVKEHLLLKEATRENLSLMQYNCSDDYRNMFVLTTGGLSFHKNYTQSDSNMEVLTFKMPIPWLFRFMTMKTKENMVIGFLNWIFNSIILLRWSQNRLVIPSISA